MKKLRLFVVSIIVVLLFSSCSNMLETLEKAAKTEDSKPAEKIEEPEETPKPAPAVVSYTVEHYQQNSNDDEYTKVAADTQSLSGTVGEQTKAAAKIYAGFTVKNFEQKTLVEGETTIIKIYYDRNTLSFKFNANGGKWKDDDLEKTVIGKRGSVLDISERPELPGFVFAGWALNYNAAGVIYDNTNSYTIPVEGENACNTLYAVWKTSSGEKAFIATAETFSEVVSSLTADAEIIIIGYLNDESVLSIRDTIKQSNYNINLTITEVTNLNSLPRYSFQDCEKLTGIVIPSSVSVIETYSFFGCAGLVSVKLPSSLTAIKAGVFSGCTKLASIDIPDTVTSIGGSAFSGCAKLTSVRMTSSITSIGNQAFMDCKELTSIDLPDSITEINAAVFAGCSNLSSIIIPDSVTTIGRSAFSGCTKLSSIKIPASVTTIIDNAFVDCSGLITVELSESVISMDSNPFYGCFSLKNVIVNENNPKYLSEDGILFNKDKTTLLIYPVGRSESSYEIPTGVTTIGEYAFNCSSNLKSLVIPSSVTSIEVGGIFNCYSLESISMPNSNLKTIGDFVFCNCRKLLSLTIPASVDKISRHVFDGLDLLTITFEDTTDWYITSNEEDWNNKENGEWLPDYWFYNNEIEISEISLKLLYKL